MRSEDREVINKFWPLWINSIKKDIISCAILSPSDTERAVISNSGVKNVEFISEEQWDLNLKSSKNWDLIVACNTFMYSPNPQLWFDNVLQSCKWFLIQDAVSGKRGNVKGYFGNDRDAARYSYKKHKSDFAGAFKLESIGKDKVVYYEIIPLVCGSKHFTACIKGNL